MQRLWHTCGTSVNHELGFNEQKLHYVALFSDPATDDPLTHCFKCGKPLHQALVDGEFTLHNGQQYQAPKKERRSVRKLPEAKEGVRAAAAAEIQRGLEEMRQRRAVGAA